MDLMSYYHSDFIKWFVLPLLIFIARLIDVSLGTLRIIFISRGLKYIAPLIAFVEINIWLLAIGQIITDINNIPCILAYAGGFAMGNLLGIVIEEKLSIGFILLRIITKHETEELAEFFRREKYGLTTVDAQGVDGKVKIIFVVMRRRDLRKILDKIKDIHPHLFYTIEDVKSIGEAMLPTSNKQRLLKIVRKGK